MEEHPLVALVLKAGFGVVFSFGPANSVVLMSLLEQAEHLTAECEMTMADYFVLQELVCPSFVLAEPSQAIFVPERDLWPK